MKILDASVIISLFKEISRPDLIDKLLLLGHKLVIPHYVMHKELQDETTKRLVMYMLKQEKMQVLEPFSAEELKSQKNYFGFGLGEYHVILSYEKLRSEGHNVYCILDDGKARNKAKNLGVKFTGTLGLVCMLKSKNIITLSEYYEILKLLNNSNFRLPKDGVI